MEQNISVRTALLHYCENNPLAKWSAQSEDFSRASAEIREKFAEGIFLIEREGKTDFSAFYREFGYEVPTDIQEYVNLFWHPCVLGYCGAAECIVLFPVIPKEGGTDDDLLFYENGLITMARAWSRIGEIQDYIPIGWLGYSGCYVLYERSTGHILLEDADANAEGVLIPRPIASSLGALIYSLQAE